MMFWYCVCVFSAVVANAHGQGVGISITVDLTQVQLGESVVITATTTNASLASVYPFVGGLQWGALCIFESGRCQVILPLPNSGIQTVQLVSLATRPTGFCGPYWPVGTALSSITTGVLQLSNVVQVNVIPRKIGFTKAPGSPRVLMEWEPWFTTHNDNYLIAEAVPLIGRYCSFDENVVRMHVIWLMDAGVDGLMVDWTNNLWGKQHFSDRDVYAQELFNATTFTLDVFMKMRAEGLTTPSMVLLPGLDNGPSEPVAALNEEIQWAADTYLSKYPQDFFFDLDGKPLIVVFDGGNIHNNSVPIVGGKWSVRYMASQMQAQRKLAEVDGYWSWMDGSLTPVAAVHNGAAEALTVTPAYFGDGGWLYPQARGRLGGDTWMQEMIFAVDKKPQILVICQWNEFEGQPTGSPTYADSYNYTFSNDLEPTSLTECALVRPGDRHCAGWGFFYHNLMAATIRMFDPAFAASNTLLVLKSPLVEQTFSSSVQVSWSHMGVEPKQFNILIDDMLVTTASRTSSVFLDLQRLHVAPGKHTISVVATDAKTLFPLSYTHVDNLASPVNPVASVVIHVV